MTAYFHNSERSVKQNNESLRGYAQWVSATRDILCTNLIRLLGESVDLNSRAKLSKRSKVAIGTISALASGKNVGSEPSIKTVEKLAKAYGVRAWEMLHPRLGASESEAEWQKKIVALRRVLDEETPGVAQQ